MATVLVCEAGSALWIYVCSSVGVRCEVLTVRYLLQGMILERTRGMKGEILSGKYQLNDKYKTQPGL